MTTYQEVFHKTKSKQKSKYKGHGLSSTFYYPSSNNLFNSDWCFRSFRKERKLLTSAAVKFWPFFITYKHCSAKFPPYIYDVHYPTRTEGRSCKFLFPFHTCTSLLLVFAFHEWLNNFSKTISSTIFSRFISTDKIYFVFTNHIKTLRSCRIEWYWENVSWSHWS